MARKSQKSVLSAIKIMEVMVFARRLIFMKLIFLSLFICNLAFSMSAVERMSQLVGSYVPDICDFTVQPDIAATIEKNGKEGEEVFVISYLSGASTRLEWSPINPVFCGPGLEQSRLWEISPDGLIQKIECVSDQTDYEPIHLEDRLGDYIGKTVDLFKRAADEKGSVIWDVFKATIHIDILNDDGSRIAISESINNGYEKSRCVYEKQ